MVEQHIKRCSASLVIRKIQLQRGYKLVKRVKICKIDNTKKYQECGNTGILITFWWKKKMVQLPYITV